MTQNCLQHSNECFLGRFSYHYYAGPGQWQIAVDTDVYRDVFANEGTTVYLEDLPTRQSSPFRRLSSTIRSHQNDCGRLRDCVSACGMRYRNRRLSCRHLIDSRLPPRYDDCTCTEFTTDNTEIPRLTYEFDAIVPMYRINRTFGSVYVLCIVYWCIRLRMYYVLMYREISLGIVTLRLTYETHYR